VFSFPEGGTGRYLAPGHSAEENAQSWVDIVFSSGDWQKPMTRETRCGDIRLWRTGSAGEHPYERKNHFIENPCA
jgi:hypothetical protein